ncbi:hypothetical protein [Diaphorobacter aerolatus]|nr:hypothetical protein [Diaphorobacter aerolatus]
MMNPSVEIAAQASMCGEDAAKARNRRRAPRATSPPPSAGSREENEDEVL